MLSDTNDALSPVVVFSIFSERRPDRCWSVAHVSVAPPVFPTFQNAGIVPSNPPIVFRFAGWAGTVEAAKASTKPTKRNFEHNFITASIEI